MKAVILAGGLGTRISEESHLKPKPMIEIGGMPILWHILKIYSSHGINDFVICLGYRGYIIKEYFANYFLHTSDVTFDLAENAMQVHKRHTEPWRITLVDTGEDTQTGGRLRRVRDYLAPDEAFCFTYGDGVGDIDIAASIRFHHEQGRLATVTAAMPPGRFGALKIEGDTVIRFDEKPAGSEGFINAGFFVLSPPVIDLIENDNIPWEAAPLEALAAQRQLSVWKHHGFWQPMDTLRDKNYLEQLWESREAPWKNW
ncbi:glucose-1-phosphate cytidylyltransferase [Betaproteobacteria bacterium]|nr:glucose-1-phosphate cytidylyltransferase [Betaproteobacteria bacterium]